MPSILIRGPENHYLCIDAEELRAVEMYQKKRTGAAVPLVYMVRLHLTEPLDLSNAKEEDIATYIDVPLKTEEEQATMFAYARAMIDGEPVAEPQAAPPEGSH
jgi:hypothetical protein